MDKGGDEEEFVPEDCEECFLEGDDDEYYDALNEETFGDCGGVYTWDWEGSQSLLQQHIKRTTKPAANQSSFKSNGIKLKCSKETTNRWIEDAKAAEILSDDIPFDISWESKIAKLVEDDDEEGEETEELEERQVVPIPPNYFVPSATKEQVKTQMTTVKPKTLEEVEREIFEQNDKVLPEVRPVPPPTKFIFLGDLERQLLEESESSGLSQRNQVPLQQHHIQFTQPPLPPPPPQVQNNWAVAVPPPSNFHPNLVMGPPPMNVNFGDGGPSGPPNFVSPHLQNFHSARIGPWIPQQQMRPLGLRAFPPGARFECFPNLNQVPPPPGLINFNQMPHPRLPNFEQVPPLRLPNFEQVPPPRLPNFEQVPPPGLRNLNQGPLPPIPMMRSVLTPPPPPGFQPNQVNQGFQQKRMSNYQSHGSLMTNEDKDRLLVIQMCQLLSTNPQTTDYYSLMYKAKQENPTNGILLLEKLFPKLSKEDLIPQKVQYEPLKFENCLGQLHAVSSLTPRRVMDMDTVTVRVTEHLNTNCSPSGRIPTYRRRHLLLEIEKIYESLLILEEAYLRSCILSESIDENPKLSNQILKASQKVEKTLTNYKKLLQIVSISKGQMLVCRVLPLINPQHRYKVLAQLLQILPFSELDDQFEKTAFPYLKRCILQTNEIRDLITITEKGLEGSWYFNHEMFFPLMASQLGVSLILCIYDHAENLLTTKCDPSILEDIEILWTRKAMGGYCAIIEKYEKEEEELPEPFEFYPRTLRHFQRFPFHLPNVRRANAIFKNWWGVTII